MENKKMNTKVLLSTLWLFATINYIYCDVFTLFHSEDLKNFLSGKVGEMVIDQNFLLTFSIVLEIPIVMILLSRMLNFKLNRILNIVAGGIMTIVQSGSLFAGAPTKHYIFFSIIEIATTISIIGIANKWRNSEREVELR